MRGIERVAIVGSGAVGAYYGAKIAREYPSKVSFLMRRDLELARESGLQIRSVDGDFSLHPVSAFATTEEIGLVDLVIIALKTTSNEELIKLLPPLLGKETRLLTLQNGLGNEEFLQTHFPGYPILGGLCHVCINRGAPGVIHHLAHGRIEMGEFNPSGQGELVHSLFTTSGLDVRLHPDLGLAQWRKLVWNIPFNGLAIAEGGIDTKAILSEPNRAERVRKLMWEVVAAASAFEYEIQPEFVESNIAKTAEMGAYLPSSLIDFLEGRAVEVDSIWGEPLRRARSRGVAMPELERLHEEICIAVKSRSS